ncbi:PucR family transcriptional regulator [Nocardia sp. NPDC057227]|uniref:PucR family transcriptional regulator n=1 Tax=Nocardia sp. NPDC057227 TaxID=3346056 RepID=UPI0036414960
MPAPTPDYPLVARLLAQWPRIAERMLAAGLGATPPAAELPAGHFTAEVLPAINACGRAVLRAVDEGRDFTRAEVAPFVAPVAERHAEDRLPLPLLLGAMHGSAQAVLHEAGAVARPDEQEQLVLIVGRLLDLLLHITVIVVEAYTEVEQSIYSAEREARRALCSALLAGRPAAELAARADTVLAEHYTVLALHLGHAEPGAVEQPLLGRRRVRVLQRLLDGTAGATVPATFDGWAGIALLPSGSEPDAARLAAELAARFGTPVHLAAAAAVRRADLPGAARETADLAELARQLGRPPGAYRLDDLLLEYQLTRPGTARARLAERIAPLLESPHLIAALDAHLRHGPDRKAAAAEIHVHPNTFSYRLRRVAELTGIDPADPGGSRLLAAALVVQRSLPEREPS